VSPNEAVHAGRRHEAMFTTKIIAKESQKERPILPPTIPVDNVATAILALNLQNTSVMRLYRIISQEWAYQKVHAFQTLVVLLCLCSSVTRWIPPDSTERVLAQALRAFRDGLFSTEAASVSFIDFSLKFDFSTSIFESIII
jgi:hypothetical protein